MRSRRNTVLGALLIVGAAVWVYAPALGGGWIWDDLAEVAHNPILPDRSGWEKIWTAPVGADYFPLKSTVQWLAWRLWGDRPAGYHALSLGLHILSALLFWTLLRRIFARANPPHSAQAASAGAWLGGMLWAVHPVAVESVAWIAELKNALSLPPLLWAMIAWVEWEDGGGSRKAFGGRNAGAFRYGEALAWFLVALLCKSSVVMLPVMLLLYAWWRRGAIDRKDIRATLPFFVLALAMGLITVWFQLRHAILGADLEIGGLFSRLAGAGMAGVFYLGKYFFPIRLAPLYPRWVVVPPRLEEFLPVTALAAGAGWLWLGRKSRGAVFAFACYVAALLPVLGFIPMAYLRIAWVADHLAYVPMLGLAGGLAGGSAWAWDRLHSGGNRRRALSSLAMAMAASVLACLGLEARRQAGIYRDSSAFWQAALERNPGAWLAQNDLGQVLVAAGRPNDAIGHYRAGLAIRPNDPEMRNNLGQALAATGRPEEAAAEFRSALERRPDFLPARINLGHALMQSGHPAEAAAAYSEALRRRPSDAELHRDLGFALSAEGRPAAAIGEYREAVRLEPGQAEDRYRLANALGNSGRLRGAIAEYEAAVRLKPDYVEARANLGLALVEDHRVTEAMAQLREALRLRPDYTEGQAYLGYALAAAGQFDAAIAEYQTALRRGSGDSDLHFNLAVALRAVGRMAEARIEFDRAAELQGGRR